MESIKKLEGIINSIEPLEYKRSIRDLGIGQGGNIYTPNGYTIGVALYNEKIVIMVQLTDEKSAKEPIEFIPVRNYDGIKPKMEKLIKKYADISVEVEQIPLLCR